MDAKETTLRELVEQAEEKVGTYKHPDIAECRERLDKVVRAAKLGGIGDDHISDIKIWRGKVTVRTEYEVRCCPQHSEFEFPEHILDADDPEKAAALWGAEKRLEKARAEEQSARDNLARQEVRRQAAEDEVQALMAP